MATERTNRIKDKYGSVTRYVNLNEWNYRTVMSVIHEESKCWGPIGREIREKMEKDGVW